VDYAALVEHGAGWLPPLTVRNPMSIWAFERAREEVEAADRVLATRDRIESQAEALGVTMPATLENGYENASGDIGPIQAAADRELDTIGAIADADRKVRAPRDVWMQLGLIGGIEPLTRVDAAKAAFAADQMPAAMTGAVDARLLIDRAGDEGRNRAVASLQLAVLIVLIVAAIVIWRIRRRRRSARLAATTVASAGVLTPPTGWTPPPTGWTPPASTWTPPSSTWAPTPERPPGPPSGVAEPPSGGPEPSGAYGTLAANLPTDQRPPATPAATPPEADQGDDD
jgi:hypothetical protein